jgi:AraC-like DNA-binding protein
MPCISVRNFDDPLACQAAAQGVEIEILPTTRGSYHVEMTQIGMDKLWMQRFRVALPQIATVATAPDRMAIGFLIETTLSNLQHCGKEITRGDIVASGYEVRHQRSASGFHYGTMSVAVEEFPTLCRTIIGREFLEEAHTQILRPHPALMMRLLKLHKVVGQLAHDTPEILALPEVGRALEERLIHLMVRCLAEGVGVESTLRHRRRGAIIARLEEILAANPDRPLYLTEICAALDVPERTLRIACEEHLGMGPIRFFTLRRMHLARQALLRADASKSTVTRIVTDYGFWELGRFSAVYRGLFGETPSETLRRPAKETMISLNRPSLLASS